MRQTQAQIPIQQLAGAKREYSDQYDWSSFQVLIAAMVIIGFLVAVWYSFFIVLTVLGLFFTVLCCE